MVKAFKASNGISMRITPDGDLVNVDGHYYDGICVLNSVWVEAVREFFQNKSKNHWKNAEPGECWILKINGEEFPAVVDWDFAIKIPDNFHDDTYSGSWISIHDDRIEDGRLLWPLPGDFEEDDE